MIIESGIIIFLGLLFLAVKLPIRTSLWLLGNALWVDLGVSVLAYIMHYGTFTGVMAAAVAGLMTSTFTTVAKYAIGYTIKNNYYPGKVWDLTNELLSKKENG